MHDADLATLVTRFRRPDTSLVLVGSHARGEAGPYSDIDLVRFLPNDVRPEDDGSHLFEGQLLVLSSVTPATVEGWFGLPQEAVNVIAGLRSAHALLDPGGRFAEIQARARAFVWDAEMARRAEAWAAGQMVGWAEEAHKGLEGLRRNDPGRLFNSRFGLSWGLARVLIVRHGILLEGDNSFYRQLREALGAASPMAGLLNLAFGLTPSGDALPLREQVEAGLLLYIATAELVHDALTDGQAQLVDATVQAVLRAQGNIGST